MVRFKLVLFNYEHEKDKLYHLFVANVKIEAIGVKLHFY